MHPLSPDLSDLTDTQIEERIAKLNRAYFITQNEHVRQQMILVLDDLKLEMENRIVAQKRKMLQDDDNDLDGLINIS